MSNTVSPLPGNITFPGYNSTGTDRICALLPWKATDTAELNPVANNSNIDQGPEIGHTGHYLAGVIGGPIGGAVGLALIVLVWLIFEKSRHDPTRKSTPSSECSQDSILERDRHDRDLESNNPSSNGSQNTVKHKKRRVEETPHRYWGDL